MRGEQAIFNIEIKKKSGLSLNPDIHHSKVFSSDNINMLQIYQLFKKTAPNLKFYYRDQPYLIQRFGPQFLFIFGNFFFFSQFSSLTYLI